MMAYRGFVVFTCLLAILAIAVWLPTFLLLLQMGLGIGNVHLHLPLGVATAHNGVAALLLVSLIYLNFQLWRQQH